METPSSPTLFSPWWQICAVAIGTLVGCLVWLPIFLQESSKDKLTEWIHYSSPGILAWISPVFQALAGWITMLSLLPVEAASLPVVIASVLAMLGFFLWAIPLLSRSLKIQLRQPTTSLMTQMFAVVVVGAITIFFVFAYAFGIDLTRGARYDFVYFPAVSVLLGASLSVYWNRQQRLNVPLSSAPAVRSRTLKATPVAALARRIKAKLFPLLPEVASGRTIKPPGDPQATSLRTAGRGSLVPTARTIKGSMRSTPTSSSTQERKLNLVGRKAVALFWLMGLISGLTVVFNLGYHKYYRPEILVPLIQQVSQPPVLIATTHKTHVQTGEMMGLAREFKLLDSSATPLFLLAHQNNDAKTSMAILQQALSQLPRPLDLWLVNFHAPSLEIKGCIADHRSFPYVDGYGYQLYHCSLAAPR